MAALKLLDKYPNRLVVKHSLSSVTTFDDVVKAETGLTSMDRVLFRMVGERLVSPDPSLDLLTSNTSVQWALVSNASTALAMGPDVPTCQSYHGVFKSTFGTAANSNYWDNSWIANDVSDALPRFLLPFAIYSRIAGVYGSAVSATIWHELFFYREEVDAETFAEFLQMAYPIG